LSIYKLVMGLFIHTDGYRAALKPLYCVMSGNQLQHAGSLLLYSRDLHLSFVWQWSHEMSVSSRIWHSLYTSRADFAHVSGFLDCRRWSFQKSRWV
jgi:hypothetical protein